MVFDRLFGSGEGDGDDDLADTRTPLPPAAIREAQSHVGDRLTDQEHDLPALLEAVQEYVDQQEYSDRPGNAFFEQVVQDFNDPQSLREPLRVTDDELLFIAGAEGWARVAEETGLTDTEMLAVRDAHQLYANREDFEAYSPLVNVMAVSMDDVDRVRELVQAADVPDEAVDLPAAREVHRGEAEAPADEDAAESA